MKIDEITEEIIGAAIMVHEQLGPGLLETAYEECLARELAWRGLAFEKQKAVPLIYRDTMIDVGFRLDLLVADQVVVELKAVEALQPVHKAQVLTYLKLTGLQVALLINFNVKSLRDGIKRLVLNFHEEIPRRSLRPIDCAQPRKDLDEREMYRDL